MRKVTETRDKLFGKDDLANSDSPSRRALLGALAAVPVAGVPALTSVAAEADPIFAQIEAAKVAESAFLSCDPTW